jgi:SNF2 family DNA or RNA helicase
VSDGGTLIGRVNGNEIRINVLGNEMEMDTIAKALRHLTALPKKTKDGSGELSLPLTWAIVTQCSKLAQQREFKWKPAPDLSQWIFHEFSRRFSEYRDSSQLKFDISTLDREPMPHQAAGAYVGAINKRFFFGDAAGTGKTMTALMTIAELDARGLNPWPAFVVAPASVVDSWLEELEACFPDWTFTAYRGTKRQQLSTRYQVYVMSWSIFQQDMQYPELADCERCGHRIVWTAKLQKAYDQWIPGGKGATRDAKAKALQLLKHQDCKKILPSKGFAVYRPVDASKLVLPPLIDFVVPKTVILDEAHCLCNKTKQSLAAKRIARIVDYVFPMSGTPIINDIGGFHTAMTVLDVKSFPDEDRYKERYTDRIRKDYGQPEVEGLTTVNREEFYNLMQGSMRYVAKSDVLKYLPPKMYSTRAVDIPPSYRAAYDEMEEDMIAHIPDTDEPLPVMNTLAQLQRLSQMASSACDVAIEYVLDENEESLTFRQMIPHYKVSMREPCWKVDEMMNVVNEYAGEPLLVFAPHTQLVNLAGKRAEAAGLRVGYITGQVTAPKKKKTRLMFQNGELDLLCLNTNAGGVGLTLHRAHTSVFLERSFAFWREDQAEDRTHRAGQYEQVHIIDIVARNTIESRVREVMKGKAGQLSDLVRDPAIVRNFLGGQKVHVL